MKESVLKQKEAVVSEIEEKIENSTSMVIVDYRGLSVSDVTELRNKFRENDVDYKVYKNTLARRAFENLGHDEVLDFLTGPNAIAFSRSDATASAKITTEFAKENKNLEIKAGMLDGRLLDPEGVNRLAKIPSREELIGKLVGSLSSPISNLVNTAQQMIHSPLRDLAYIAETLAERKESEEA